MKFHLILFSVLFFIISCSEKKENTAKKLDSVTTDLQKNQDTMQPKAAIIKSIPLDTISTPDEIETFYIVIVDSSLNYYLLHKKMFELQANFNIAIDTLGRYYNPKKDLIALPDNHADEIYAGDYFPRRYPSETLSLEYLSFYKNNTEEKTIVLICGIYENEMHATNTMKKIQKVFPKTFTLKTAIFLGCMH